MNLSEPQNQAHRPSISSNTCDRHPDEIFTGFCPLCLCERLSILDHSSSLRKPNSTNNKAIFKVSSSALGSGSKASSSAAAATNSFCPELRRTQSFSASRERFSGVFEPQRKSCDVRVRNTLWSLFNQDDERKGTTKSEGVRPEVDVETRNLACCSSSSFVAVAPVFESKEEEEEEEDEVVESEYEEEDEGDEIRVCDEQEQHNVPNVGEIRVEETVEGAIEDERNDRYEEEMKTIKYHIDLDSQNKKAPGRDFKEIAGSFWSAASVFSKKLQKWRQKQKLKKHGNGGGCSTLPVEKPIGQQYRETQSEIADYGFGRRSCDTDPRFSLDAGRMSFDDPRYSFDEPRASWDGHLIGKTFPRLTPMLAVVEDVPVNHVPRFDKHIPVEEPRISINDDETLPGGSIQTRDYYSDSSSRRRKSLDRSNSRKTTASVVAEMDEMKSVANANMINSPDFRDSNSNSLRDDYPETIELGYRDNASIINNGEKKETTKKSRRWIKALNIWGLIHWRTGSKYDDEDRFSRTNGVERSYSESWQDLRSDPNGDLKAGLNRKILRSNSSASWRNSNGIEKSFRNGAKANNSVDLNGHKHRKRDDFVLERNRTTRYSPNHIDNGLLKLYLTPMRGNWRSASTGKSRANHTHSMARSVLRLY